MNGQETIKINIRRMTPEDVPVVAALEKKCFSMPWSEKAYLETLANENALYLVAESDGAEKRIVGMCGVLDILGEGDISNVAVEEDFRRQGIAKKLLQELLVQGESRGIDAFTLEVRATNKEAIGLYEKFGFVLEGVRKNFYENPKEDAFIMWKRRKKGQTE